MISRGVIYPPRTKDEVLSRHWRLVWWWLRLTAWWKCEWIGVQKIGNCEPMVTSMVELADETRLPNYAGACRESVQHSINPCSYQLLPLKGAALNIYSHQRLTLKHQALPLFSRMTIPTIKQDTQDRTLCVPWPFTPGLSAVFLVWSWAIEQR